MLFKRNKENVKSGKIVKEEIGEKGIYVLGSGCRKCNELEKNMEKALKERNIDEEIKHITDFGTIAEYGVISTPALVIDSRIVSYGRVLSQEECSKILSEVR